MINIKYNILAKSLYIPKGGLKSNDSKISKM